MATHDKYANLTAQERSELEKIKGRIRGGMNPMLKVSGSPLGRKLSALSPEMGADFLETDVTTHLERKIKE